MRNYKYYKGYKVYDDGTIVGKHGTPIKHMIGDYGHRYVKIYPEGEPVAKSKMVSKLVYVAFNNMDYKDLEGGIRHIDGDLNNFNLSNLIPENEIRFPTIPVALQKKIINLYKTNKRLDLGPRQEGYLSYRDISNMFDISYTTVGALIRAYEGNELDYLQKE